MSEHPNSQLDLTADVTEFFRGAVEETIREHGFDATEAAETYVVGVLAEYTRPGELTGATLSRPLTLELHDALQATGHERFERLRVLGDSVLYLGGFFSEHLETRGVALDYVSSLGASAYDRAASMLTRRALLPAPDPSGAHDVFRELSANFGMFVRLVGHVAEGIHAGAAKTDHALLKVYERWLKTGSDTLANALLRRGLAPMKSDGTVH